MGLTTKVRSLWQVMWFGHVKFTDDSKKTVTAIFRLRNKIFVYPEKEGSSFLRNVGNFLKHKKNHIQEGILRQFPYVQRSAR
jgi:hypothetical protein